MLYSQSKAPPVPDGWKAIRTEGLRHTVAFRVPPEGLEQLQTLALTLPEATIAGAIRWVMDQPITQELITARIAAFAPEDGE